MKKQAELEDVPRATQGGDDQSIAGSDNEEPSAKHGNQDNLYEDNNEMAKNLDADQVS
jgi:hypothetical protein